MNIQIGLNLRDSNDFDLTIDPIGKYTEPKSPYTIECENNEATLIKVNIDIIHFSRISEYFLLLLSKLRRKGKLIIHGYNLNEINRLFYLGTIDENQFNNLICQDYPNINICSIYTPSFIKNKLQELGLSINSVKLDNITYYIEASRE